MAETREIKAVELVRWIRDEQSAALAGKSEKEILDFYRKAGESMRAKTRRPSRAVESGSR